MMKFIKDWQIPIVMSIALLAVTIKSLDTDQDANNQTEEMLVSEDDLISTLLYDGVLTVESGDESDWVEVQQTDTQIIVHSFNKDRSVHLGQYEFDLTDVSKIQFFGNGGDDRFIAGYANKLITVDCFIDTGTGSNFIVGGKGDNTFVNNGTESSMFVWVGTAEVRGREWVKSDEPGGGHFVPTDEIRTPGSNRWVKGSKENKSDGFLLLSHAKEDVTVEYPDRPWKGEEVFKIIGWIDKAKDIIGNYKFFTGVSGSAYGSSMATVYVNDNPNTGLGGQAHSNCMITLYPCGIHQSTFYHEIAHLWDTRSVALGLGDISFAVQKNTYTKIPHGVDVMDKFGIRKTAVPEDFANGYGMSNSAEDWATMVEAYLMKYKPDGKSDKYKQKYQIVDEFFRYTVNPPPPNPPKPKAKSAYAATAAPLDPNAKPITIPGTRVILMPGHMGEKGCVSADLDNPKISHPMDMTYYDWTKEDVAHITSHVKFIYDKLGSYAFLCSTNNKAENPEGYIYCYKYEEGSYGSAYPCASSVYFTPDAISDVSVFVHEVAHLWDYEADNPFIGAFRAVSWDAGHVMKNGSTLDDFARQYGMTNSKEDWACMVTDVLVGSQPVGKSNKYQQKVRIVNQFFNSLKK